MYKLCVAYTFVRYTFAHRDSKETVHVSRACVAFLSVTRPVVASIDRYRNPCFLSRTDVEDVDVDRAETARFSTLITRRRLSRREEWRGERN